MPLREKAERKSESNVSAANNPKHENNLTLGERAHHLSRNELMWKMSENKWNIYGPVSVSLLVYN